MLPITKQTLGNSRQGIFRRRFTLSMKPHKARLPSWVTWARFAQASRFRRLVWPRGGAALHGQANSTPGPGLRMKSSVTSIVARDIELKVPKLSVLTVGTASGTNRGIDARSIYWGLYYSDLLRKKKYLVSHTRSSLKYNVSAQRADSRVLWLCRAGPSCVGEYSDF